jgi:PadR family transcriptional regulator PadR
MATSDLKLLQGTLDLLVLKSLAFGSRHGVDVAEWIRATSDDELRIDDGALYTALHRMQRRGWCAAEWGLSKNNRKAKYYRLTKDGRKQLKSDAALWARYAQAVFKILDASAQETS